MVSIFSGRVTSTRAVSSTYGYSSVTRIGRFCMAVGRTQAGFLVTTG